MKRLSFIVILIISSIICYGQKTVFSRNGNTQIEAKDEVWDFGTIKEDGGIVKHLFLIKNTSDKPFVINDVTTTCGCTIPKYIDKPLMPNDTTYIEVGFDPFRRPGVFSKRVYIWSNNDGVTNVLTIKGNVER